MARPPFAEDQLRATEDGRIALTLRRKAKSGQSVILLEPVRQLRRLAWLIPPARQHQVRFHGILAPAAKDRSRVVAKPPFKLQLAFPLENMHPERSSYRVPWAKLLARVYDVAAQVCIDCGGALKPMSAVTDAKQAREELRDGIAVLGETHMARAPPDPA